MKTYPRVMQLLKEKEEETGSVNAIVKRTGLTHNTITNYLAGRSEPNQKSLELISSAYGKPVSWLRGDSDITPTLPPGTIDTTTLSPTKRRLIQTVIKTSEEKAKAMLTFLES